MTVSRFRLGEAVGRLGDEELEKVCAALQVAIGCDTGDCRRRADFLMGESRPAKRILAFATAALLSGVAAPRVQAQESEWLEVQGSTSLTSQERRDCELPHPTEEEAHTAGQGRKPRIG